ncbi:hypothetical protein D3C71_1852670 [compost metagenome]
MKRPMHEQLRGLVRRGHTLPAHQPETSYESRRTMRAIIKKFQRLQDARIDVMNQCSIEIEQYDGRWRQIWIQRRVPQIVPKFAVF